MTEIAPRPTTVPSLALAPAAPPAPAHVSKVGTVVRLTLLELRLIVREPILVVSLVGFPAVMVLVIAGVFGQAPDPEFGGVAPDDYYVASYVGIVLASLGLITIPVHIATNRQLGVLRRFTAAGLDGRVVGASHIALGVVLGVVAGAIVLGVGNAVYGIGFPERPLAALGWFVVGLACFIAIGLALGSVLHTSRVATALGNLLFVPIFLLGGGGPPRAVMTAPMRTIADALPLTHVVGGMRAAWLGSTDEVHTLWWPVLVTAACLTLAAARTSPNP